MQISGWLKLAERNESLIVQADEITPSATTPLNKPSSEESNPEKQESMSEKDFEEYDASEKTLPKFNRAAAGRVISIIILVFSLATYFVSWHVNRDFNYRVSQQSWRSVPIEDWCVNEDLFDSLKQYRSAVNFQEIVVFGGAVFYVHLASMTAALIKATITNRVKMIEHAGHRYWKVCMMTWTFLLGLNVLSFGLLAQDVYSAVREESDLSKILRRAC